MFLERLPQARAVGLFNGLLDAYAQFIRRRAAGDCFNRRHGFPRVARDQVDEEVASLRKARERDGAQKYTGEPWIGSSIEARAKRSESFVGPQIGEGEGSFGGKLVARLEYFGDEGNRGRPIK
jgi:hypothetical protein